MKFADCPRLSSFAILALALFGSATLLFTLGGCGNAEPSGAESGAKAIEVQPEDLEIGGREAHSGDPLADEVFRIIRDFIELSVDREDREALIKRLRDQVDALALGEEIKRSAAVTGLVDEIISQAERYRPSDGRPGEVTGQQRLFVVGQAQKSADRLRATLRGEATGEIPHEGHERAPYLAPEIDGVDVPDGYLGLSWKTISSFPYEEGKPLPKSVTSLRGKKVAIAGYMMAIGEYQNIRRFLLVESFWACCFGIVPDINESVEVQLPPSDPGLELVTLPVLAMGVFRAEEQREQGYVIGLYRMDGDDVIEVD